MPSSKRSRKSTSRQTSEPRGTTESRRTSEPRRTTESRRTSAPRQTTESRRSPASPRKPRAKRAAASPLARLREICLALPDAHEVEAWGEPTFRVKNKIFAMYASAGTHHSPDRPSVWILSVNLEQDLILRTRPDRYFKPPYVGPSGWVGAWLDRNPPWREIAELLRDGYERRRSR